NAFTVLGNLAKGEKADGSRRVRSFERGKDGMIVSTKARLVARVLCLGKVLIYVKTPAPTPAAASVKIVVAVDNELGCRVRHLDTEHAFTRAELRCPVCTKLPGGCSDLSGRIPRLEST
ncbi:unnamed protein product, partial [Hapterophycus canaliculatus]